MTKREQMNKETELILMFLIDGYEKGLSFEEVLNRIPYSRNLIIRRLRENGVDWKQHKNNLNENFIEYQFEVLDLLFMSNVYEKDAELIFAENVYDIIGKNHISEQYVKERDIINISKRYVIEHDDGTKDYVSKSNHPLYDNWKQMHQRCGYDGKPQDHHYSAYVLKGIKICKEWLKEKNGGDGLGFDRYYDHMMMLGWKPGLVGDRIDNDGMYKPGNVMPITKEENGRKAQAHKTKIVKLKNKITGQEFIDSINQVSKYSGLNSGSLSLKLKGSKVYKDWSIEIVK